MKCLSRRTLMIIVAYLLLLVMLLCGCGKKFKMDDSMVFPGDMSTVDSVHLEEDVPLAEETPPLTEPVSEETIDSRIILKVENKEVYLNGQHIEYRQDDANDLLMKLEEQLSGSTEVTLLVDFNSGDDDICTSIEELLQRMTFSVENYINEK